jgi:hypothetical protein
MLFESRLPAYRATSANSMLNMGESRPNTANSAKALETCREFKGNWHLSRSR